MIQKYKIQACIDEIHWSANPTAREAKGGRRAQHQKEVKTTMTTGFNFFTNRLVNNWNRLTDSTVITLSNKKYKNFLILAIFIQTSSVISYIMLKIFNVTFYHTGVLILNEFSAYKD